MAKLLDSDAIDDLLRDLARRLDARGVDGRIFVVGGAAMALAYGRGRATQDVDGVFEPKDVVYEAARDIAEERGLDRDWLNDGVKGFLHEADPDASTYLDVPGLRVELASPRYLFVLKAMAARVDRDAGDLVRLYHLCGFSDVDDALDHVQRHAPTALLTPKTAFFVRELLHGEDEG